jgi:hypothetical protein
VPEDELIGQVESVSNACTIGRSKDKILEAILSFFDELRASFRIVDAIDILLVSVFLYAMLVRFQRAASRGVLMGLASLAVVYILARGLGMYLTSLAFHTTFAVLLFILVVVFQEDLRRLLERVSTFRSVKFGQAHAIPMHSGKATRNTTIDASTSCLMSACPLPTWECCLLLISFRLFVVLNGRPRGTPTQSENTFTRTLSANPRNETNPKISVPPRLSETPVVSSGWSFPSVGDRIRAR